MHSLAVSGFSWRSGDDILLETVLCYKCTLDLNHRSQTQARIEEEHSLQTEIKLQNIFSRFR